MPYPSVAYQTNPSTSSCPSTFQLVVASVVWLPNSTSARAKHSSSSKSSCTSGYNCQFIVESDFEGAQAYDVAQDSILRRHCRRRRRRYRRHHNRRSTLFVVSVDSKIFLHICDDCRIFREGEWEKNIGSSGLFGRLVSPNFAVECNELIEPNDVGPSNLIVKYFILR